MQNQNKQLVESILNKDFNEAMKIFNSLMSRELVDKVAVMKTEVAEDFFEVAAALKVRRGQVHQKFGFVNKLPPGITDKNRIKRRNSMYNLIKFFKPMKQNKTSQKLNRKIGVNKKPTNHISLKKG